MVCETRKKERGQERERKSSAFLVLYLCLSWKGLGEIRIGSI